MNIVQLLLHFQHWLDLAAIEKPVICLEFDTCEEAIRFQDQVRKDLPISMSHIAGHPMKNMLAGFEWDVRIPARPYTPDYSFWGLHD